jgi:hypothetical protein
VNGVSLVGVSQKLAAETLSSCAINPDTGLVQFLVARQGEPSSVSGIFRLNTDPDPNSNPDPGF